MSGSARLGVARECGVCCVGLLVNHSVNRAIWERDDGVARSEHRGGLGRVNEDVVLLKLSDVGFDLVHLCLKDFFAAFLADGVEFAVVRLLLVLFGQLLVLLLKGGDQLLTFLFGHQHALAILLVLLLNLHLTNKVVFVFDLLLDFSDVLGHPTVGLLLEHVLLLGSRHLRGSEDVLDSIGDDEVLIRDETVNGLLVTLRHCLLLLACALELSDFFLADEHGVASASLLEVGLVGSEGSLGSAHGTTCSLCGVSSSLEVEFSGEVRALGLRCGLQAKRGCSRSQVGRVLRLVALLFLGHELLLGDQIVDAFLVLDHL